MSLHQQLLEKEYKWLYSELMSATTANIDQESLDDLAADELDRVRADGVFLSALRLIKSVLVNNVAAAFQTYVEEQRMRRDFKIARTGHRELAKGLMTLKLRRFNHIGRLLKLDSDLSPKPQESSE